MFFPSLGQEVTCARILDTRSLGTEFEELPALRGGVMSLAQMGSESVWMIIDGEKYFVRELFVPSSFFNKSILTSHEVVLTWKTWCSTCSKINFGPSERTLADFKISIKIQDYEYSLHFNSGFSALGTKHDIRLICEALIPND